MQPPLVRGNFLSKICLEVVGNHRPACMAKCAKINDQEARIPGRGLIFQLNMSRGRCRPPTSLYGGMCKNQRPGNKVSGRWLKGCLLVAGYPRPGWIHSSATTNDQETRFSGRRIFEKYVSRSWIFEKYVSRSWNDPRAELFLKNMSPGRGTTPRQKNSEFSYFI